MKNPKLARWEHPKHVEKLMMLLEKLESGETLLHFDKRQSSFRVLNYFFLMIGAALFFPMYDVFDGGALFFLILLI